MLPELTIEEERRSAAARLAGQRKQPALAAAGAVLERLRLGELRGRRPSRSPAARAKPFAVARALVHRPAVVFADDDPATLDSANASAVLKEFLDLARSRAPRSSW